MLPARREKEFLTKPNPAAQAIQNPDHQAVLKGKLYVKVMEKGRAARGPCDFAVYNLLSTPVLTEFYEFFALSWVHEHLGVDTHRL